MNHDSALRPVRTTFRTGSTSVSIDARFLSPPEYHTVLVFGHGAGAGMDHPFMERASQGLAGKGIATFRYQFPYMQQKKKKPDSPKVLIATVRSAVSAASEIAGSVPLFAGGKSMGGRMTSQAEAENHLEGVKGLVFFGFPLHPPGSPSTGRAEHLFKVSLPMLFLQGTRDKLADIELIAAICGELGSKATLHVVEGGDHSFHLPKSLKKTDQEAIDDLVSAVDRWKAPFLG